MTKVPQASSTEVLRYSFFPTPSHYTRAHRPKTHLYDAHRQARLFGQLLPDVPCRLRRLIEGRLEHLQLLGLDGGARTAPLRTVGIVGTFVLRLGIAASIRIAVQGALREKI